MVIRLVLERALSDVAPVFLPMVRDWQQMADRYTDDELRLIVEFYGRMEQVLRTHLARLRGPAEAGATAEAGGTSVVGGTAQPGAPAEPGRNPD